MIIQKDTTESSASYVELEYLGARGLTYETELYTVSFASNLNNNATNRWVSLTQPHTIRMFETLESAQAFYTEVWQRLIVEEEATSTNEKKIA